jgi:ATP-dependent helicase HrpA
LQQRPAPAASPLPPELLARYNAASERLLIADDRRLDGLLRRAAGGQPVDFARFGRDLDAALLKSENRLRLKPAVIAFPEELPVSQAREEIGRAILDNQVIVLCGETGSGKTTQLPKLCLELGRGRRGLIGHTQPRRLAARSVANRIAQELGSPLGQLVGYETRFDRRVGDASLVKLMTDGILLAELQRDRELTAYDTIIIDEAHERSLNIDFLLGWLRTLLPRRPDLKLIVTSATLDPERLAKHFENAKGPAPILKVEGRTFPVTMRYREPDPDLDLEGQVGNGIDELWAGGGRPGDVLVFLPGEREIRDLARSLPGRFPKAEVLPLYSRLPAEQQDRVFGRGSAPRIVLATNVAETSVTVPGIRYVVDTGTARINRYSTRLGVQQLQIEGISQAAANQRAGRCGRVGPGTCLRLYTEADFQGRDEFTDPEVLRANLAGVILQMAALGLGDVDDFPWVDAPENRHVSEGYRLLQVLGALDDDRALTRLGRELARLPLDPRIARIVAAGKGQEQDAVCVLAAALSVQDPHEVPPDQQTQARQKHAVWRHARSDFYTLLNLWREWQKWSEGTSNRALRKICREQYVSYLRMEEWESVYKQIVDMTRDKNGARAAFPTQEKLEELYPQIHKALAAGLIDHIGLRLPAEKNERPEFQGPRGRKYRVFPGSTLAKKPPPWLLSAQLSQTSQLFARTNADVLPQWLSEVGAHLVKKTVTHPLWNAERGEVQCTEYHTLFGLQLLKRNCHYGSIDPVDARRIFITEGLVRGLWTAKPRFLTDNLKLVEDVQDKEARMRRPDLLADESQLFAFYDERIPKDVCTANNLKAWLRTASADKGDPGRILKMKEPDVLRPGANADVEDLFPDLIDIGGHTLQLSYQHEPGEDEDGVSFHIPLTLLYQLPDAPFDWLVPGLRAPRIEALIRSLPMNLRRQCTPAAEYANALSARMQIEEGDFLLSMARHFDAMIGVKLKPDDFDIAKLPAHLKPTLVLEDAQNKVLARAESLAALKKGQAEPARAAIAVSAQREDVAKRWVRSEVKDWDFGDLPEHVDLANGARAWPALTTLQSTPVGADLVRDSRRQRELEESRTRSAPTKAEMISLALFESPDAARAAHIVGVRALLLSKLSDRMRDLVKTAKSKLGLSLIGSTFDPEVLARAVAERAAAQTWKLAELRTETAFKDAVQHRGEFGRLAVKLLDDVCGWLLTVAELRKSIRALNNRWPDSIADMGQQLDSLLAPGFIDALPDAQWPRVSTWLKAIATRLQRLPNKPQRDIDMTLPLRKLVAQLPGPFHSARWLLEEWRVAQFAQELKAQGSPSAERINALIKEPA